MVSGRSVLRDIDSVIAAAKRTHTTNVDTLATSRTVLDETGRDLASAYESLAEVYLPGLTTSAVAGAISEVKSIAAEELSQKHTRIETLATLLKAEVTRLGEREEAFSKVSESLDVTIVQKKGVLAQISDALSKDAAYGTLQEDLVTKTAEMQTLARRAVDFQESAQQKLVPYTESRIFMYLLGRNVGTPEAEGITFTKNVDRLLARFADYDANKRSYDILTNMPGALTQLVIAEETEVSELTESATTVETNYEKELGLPPLNERENTLVMQKNGAHAQVTASESQIDVYESEQTRLSSSEGVYYGNAKDRIVDAFENESLSGLFAMARSTPDAKDDGIVARIGSLEDSLVDLDAQLKIEDMTVNTSALKLSELRDLRRTFVDNNYETSNSEFSYGFDVDDLLGDFISGRSTINSVMSEIRRKQDFEYSSSSSSSGGGGGFGGGSSSSGGSFGGGSYSTGGGF
jgi:hypothetical protein